MVELRLGKRTYLLNHPDDVRHVLVANAANYEKTPRLTSRRGRWLSGEGLLTLHGEEHLRRRRLLQPAFNRREMERLSGMILRETDAEIGSWREGEEIEIASAMMRLSRNAIVRAVLGEGCDDILEGVGRAVETRREFIGYVFASLLPFPEHHPTPLRFKYAKAIRLLDDVIRRRIQECRCRQAEDCRSEWSFIGELVCARGEGGRTLSDSEVRDEALTLLITGYETIGAGLAWTLWLMLGHPEWAEQVRQEVARVLGGGIPLPSNLQSLARLGAVYAESLRLYPPSWIMVRMARKSDVLPSGARLPEGSKLYLSEYTMHRNPRYWRNAESFDPSRFLNSGENASPRAYFPFGAGPRVCIGEPLARLESMLVLARLVQRVRFEIVPNQRIVPIPKIILWPKHGIRLRVKSIDSSSEARHPEGLCG